MYKYFTFSKHAKEIPVRFSSSASLPTDNCDIKPFVHNRNPRNLERLRIARKPWGYHLEVPGREFWHKLEITQKSRYVTASVIHFSGAKVIEASTNEWAIKKYLYRCTDSAAYMNLARVFAQRCLECGISHVFCNIEAQPDGKIAAFLSEVEKSGLTLTEPSRFMPAVPWDKLRPEKPWEVVE